MDSKQKLEYGKIYNTTRDKRALYIGTIPNYDGPEDYLPNPSVPRQYRLEYNPIRVILYREGGEIYACKFRYYLYNSFYLQIYRSEGLNDLLPLYGNEEEYADELLKKYGL